MVKKGPRALVSISCAQISGVVSTNEPRSQAAAAFTSALAGPMRRSASAISAGAIVQRRQVGADEMNLRARVGQLGRRAFALAAVAPRDHDAGAALGDEPGGDGEPQTLAAADDDSPCVRVDHGGSGFPGLRRLPGIRRRSWRR